MNITEADIKRVLEHGHTDVECFARDLCPEAFEPEPVKSFESTCDNMHVTNGTYKVSNEAKGYICKIKDGMLYREPSVEVPGIETDKKGQILIHPDSK